jgi:hypothetical protein
VLLRIPDDSKRQAPKSSKADSKSGPRLDRSCSTGDNQDLPSPQESTLKNPLPALVLSLVSASAAQAQLAAGPEFHVNTYTTDGQYSPAVASDGSGNFVVVWTSQAGQDGDLTGVFGQRYNAAGVPQGPEFRVNTYTTQQQLAPAIASDANGNFVVAWASYQDPDAAYFTLGIYAQRFDAQGAPLGGEFRVNTYTSHNQHTVAVGMDASGNFVVTWESDFQADQIDLFGQRFDAAGVPQGSEFQVNTYTTGFQQVPSVAVVPAGNFLVVWQSESQDGSQGGIFGRCFTAAGVPQGAEFRVNSTTAGNQLSGAAAAGGNGKFVVVWGSPDGDAYGIFGQRLDSGCAPEGPEFPINTYTTFQQLHARVAADGAGNFTVAWDSFPQEIYGYGVFARRFAASGLAVTSEFHVNSYTLGNQKFPAVAVDPDGDFIVVWAGDGQNDTLGGVFGQRYGDLIFEDGFDSDSLVHWSSSSTDGGDLRTSAASAMAGTSRGLRARVNDTNPLFVEDDTPNAENRYRVRFYFDTNAFDPGEASGHFRTRLFFAQGSGFRLVTIVLKRQGGAYSVEARVRSNSGARIDTGFKPITDGPHFLEFDWQRATAPAALDGALELWIDDVSVATLAGIDNDAFGVDQGRLGALSVKVGAAGTLFFDQFESRRLAHIGPE